MKDVIRNEIIERIDRLERENRRLKRFGKAGLLVVLAAVLCGAWKADEAKKVETQVLVIRDPAGNVRGTLGADPNGLVALQLFDQARRSRFSAIVSDNGLTDLSLRSGEGKSETSL